jgi:hypothetical protein
MPNPFTPCWWATPATSLGVACPQGVRPAAVFYSFGHPTPYAYDLHPWKKAFYQKEIRMTGNEKTKNY